MKVYFAIIFICLLLHYCNGQCEKTTVQKLYGYQPQPQQQQQQGNGCQSSPTAAPAPVRQNNNVLCKPKVSNVLSAISPNVDCQPAPVRQSGVNCKLKEPRVVYASVSQFEQQQQQEPTIDCGSDQFFCLIKSVPYQSIAINRVIRTQFQHHISSGGGGSYRILNSAGGGASPNSYFNSNDDSQSNGNNKFVLYLDNQYDRNRFNQEIAKHREHMQDLGAYYKVYEEPPQCDEKFCEKYGDGINYFKVCSPEHCHCANGRAFLQRCGPGTVFDPRNKVCNWPHNVIGC